MIYGILLEFPNRIHNCNKKCNMCTLRKSLGITWLSHLLKSILSISTILVYTNEVIYHDVRMIDFVAKVKLLSVYFVYLVAYDKTRTGTAFGGWLASLATLPP